MKKRTITAIIAIMACCMAYGQAPKYIFYFIGDGMGFNQVLMTNLYNSAMGQEDLNFSEFPVLSMIRTASASSLVTDSSAAGTALATSTKTANGRLGTDTCSFNLMTIAEMAKMRGYAAGVATSVGINHATPGSFYGHVEKRSQYADIFNQLIESDLDFAAGATILRHDEDPTAEELAAKAAAAGINVFTGKNSYKPVKGRVICLGDDLDQSCLAPAIDRKEGQTELADFTAAAIDHLNSISPRGFFLMVEGGQIDYTCHSRDAAGTVAEINDMAKSVGLALEFAAKHPKETLILVTSDHETGGCCIGGGHYDFKPEILQYQKCSKNALTDKLYALYEKEETVSWPSVKNVLRKELGLWDKVEVEESFEKKLTLAYKETYLDGTRDEDIDLYSSNANLAKLAVDYLATKQAGVTWAFSSHSGAQVGLFVYGAKANAFLGCRDNTEVPKLIAKLAGYIK